MTLALLVYIVNNLTYSGTFFFTFAVLALILYASVDLFEKIHLYISKNHPVSLSEGSIYTLKVSISKDFAEGDQVRIEKIWYGLQECRVSSLDGTKYRSVKLRTLVKAVKAPETVYIPIVTPKKSWLYFAVAFFTLHTLLPSKETTMYMAGAYLVENVITSDKAKKLGDATYDAAIVQVKKWSEEAPELKEMLKPLLLEEKK